MQLTAENLVIERGGRMILDGLSLSVGAGEVMVLTGPNGAGKTTLLRAIAGFLPLVSGRIRLDGGDAEAEIGQQCHVVGHRDGIKANLTVGENAAFWRSYLGGSAPVEAALGAVGLAALADVPAGYLSAGQRRRLGLSRLCLAPRPVWLLDEPTVSLDVAGVDVLADLVRKHAAGGGLVIAATHVPLGLGGVQELRLGVNAGGAA